MNRIACFFAAAVALVALPPTRGAETASAVAPAQGVTPPGLNSPVGFLRQLLAASAAEREQLLANKSPVERGNWLKFVEQYQTIPPKEREYRLRATEFRLLMNTPPAARAPYFASVPAADLSFFQERLKLWDMLPEELRKEPLVIEYFLQFEDAAPPTQGKTAKPIPDEIRNALAKSLAIPQAQRLKITDGFERFLVLPADQKEKTLKGFTGEERQKLENTLKAFEKLPADQRAKSLTAFQKLASMESKDRDGFLQNAARWQAMSPEERNSMESLVKIIPGGLPPLPGTTPPMPPIRGVGLPTKTQPATAPALPVPVNNPASAGQNIPELPGGRRAN